MGRSDDLLAVNISCLRLSEESGIRLAIDFPIKMNEGNPYMTALYYIYHADESVFVSVHVCIPPSAFVRACECMAECV